MTEQDAKRLAQIRNDNEQWQATTDEAFDWDATFLIRLLDELLAAKALRKDVNV